jgi:DHA1 family tetracycline resistance protein-like MFS transporter
VNRGLLPIFLVVLIDVLGLTIIFPLLPFYTERFGASPFVVGLLVSSYAVCQLISGPLLGQWSDHVGRKPLLLLSQCGTLAGFLLLAFAGSLKLIFLARIIDGLTAGNLSVAQAYISDTTEPGDRAAAFGKIGLAFGIGFFLGPALTSFLFRYGYHAPILAAAALSASSIVATAFLIPGGPGPARKADPGRRAQVGLLRSWKLFGRVGLPSLLAQVFLFYFAFSAYMSGFALFAERRFVFRGHALGPREIGYAFTYFGFLGIIIQGFLIGRIVRAAAARKIVLAGFLSAGLGYALLSRIQGPLWIAITGIFTGFGAGVLRPLLTSEISRGVGRTEQGLVLGLNQSLQSVAQITAPMVSTLLIERGWLDLWAWFPAAICLIGTALALSGSREGAITP